MLMFARLRRAMFRIALLIPVSGLSSLGCSGDDASSVSSVPQVRVEDEAPAEATVAFAEPGPLALAPGQSVELIIEATPAGRHEVSFVLVGDDRGAALNETTTLTGDNGRGTVVMQAPDTFATFALRARIDGGTPAELSVSVSDQGFGTIEVVPQYEGRRPVDRWEAGVLAGKTCEELSATLPASPPGGLTATSDADFNPVIALAPVGPSLAVYVRAGRYLLGCTNETRLSPNERLAVDVAVLNVPLDPSGVELDLDMSFAPDPTAWSVVLAEAEVGILTAYALGSVEVSFFDAMTQLSPSPSFAQEATDAGLLAALRGHFETTIGYAETLRDWSSVGLLTTTDPLVTQLRAYDRPTESALLRLDQLAGASADALGVPDQYVVSFGVDPEDTVHVGGQLFLRLSRLVGHAIAEQGKSVLTEVTGRAAVVRAASCDTVAWPSLPSCDANCLTALCDQAAGAVWDEAISADSTTAEITMQVAGDASFDDDAKLTGFDGEWLGKIEVGEVEFTVTGTANSSPSTPTSNGPT
ncbi:MAG: hypothetical protein AAGA56_05540 [Myxococcota bacterium]